MTTVETRVVDPVHQHSSVNVTPAEVDAALSHEEEKMLDDDELSVEDKLLDDEEINSCEVEDVEEHMLNVAIMNSVVETVTAPAAISDSGPESPRYGLRKRQRPGDSVDSLVETPGHTPPVSTTAVIVNGRLSLIPANSGSLGDVGGLTPKEEPLIQGAKAGSRINSGRPRAVQPIAPNIPVEITSSDAGIHQHPGAEPPTLSVTPKRRPPPNRQNTKPKGSMSSDSALQATPVLVPTSGAVPNPLSRSTPPPSSLHLTSEPPMRTVDHGAPLVPCPLSEAVPCPLPEQTASEPAHSDKRVTIVEPPVLMTRNRIFSVDLDPFDFADMAGDKADDDVNLEDITAANIPDDLAPFKRDRAFSFEFFTFNGDELLSAPPIAPASTVPLPEPTLSDHFDGSGRPRGDSIIFDPSSFQDGGIHEENAIIKAKAAVTKGKVRTQNLLADSRLATSEPVPVRPQPQPPRPIAAAAHPGPSISDPDGYHSSTPVGTENGQVATLPSALSVPDANGNIAGTFQMELLNKDGRIGIYLPDARRARIARFHAKRKMRIWRKRIKYDCRKKLADSRPRIKGRFVKRSDMDE